MGIEILGLGISDGTLIEARSLLRDCTVYRSVGIIRELIIGIGWSDINLLN